MVAALANKIGEHLTGRHIQIGMKPMQMPHLIRRLQRHSLARQVLAGIVAEATSHLPIALAVHPHRLEVARETVALRVARRVVLVEAPEQILFHAALRALTRTQSNRRKNDFSLGCVLYLGLGDHVVLVELLEIARDYVENACDWDEKRGEPYWAYTGSFVSVKFR